MMKSEEDRMEYLPGYEQEAINILLEVLKKSKEPVEVLSFGSARILAVAYNRAPQADETEDTQNSSKCRDSKQEP